MEHIRLSEDASTFRQYITEMQGVGCIVQSTARLFVPPFAVALPTRLPHVSRPHSFQISAVLPKNSSLLVFLFSTSSLTASLRNPR
ncbi:hypothetical protein OROHE_000045 [Orobanche hederae]